MVALSFNVSNILFLFIIFKMKIPYEIVFMEVQKLYSKELDVNNPKALDEHLNFIESFIIACGYSVDEYVRLMWLGDNRSLC